MTNDRTHVVIAFGYLTSMAVIFIVFCYPIFMQFVANKYPHIHGRISNFRLLLLRDYDVKCIYIVVSRKTFSRI